MDESELLVERYLTHLGYSDIVYEPDGNVPPDFLVEGKIAVEVRRLNQNYENESSYAGLEMAAIPLWISIKKYLVNLGPPVHGKSWYVFYRFSRPLQPWKIIKKKLDAALDPFLVDANAVGFDQDLGDGFELHVTASTLPYSTLFVLIGNSDEESGGWLLDELERNLKITVQEKTDKIARHRAKYPIWWLIMPDHIAYGMDDFDYSLFRDQITVTHSFDKIILLDPRNHLRAVEI